MKPNKYTRQYWSKNTVQNLEAENTAAHARYDEVMVENKRLNGELEEQAAEIERLRNVLHDILVNALDMGHYYHVTYESIAAAIAEVTDE